MTNIRRPGDYTNTFSKAENMLMQSLIDRCGRQLAEHAHAELDKTKFRVAEELPRQQVRDRLIKMVARKGWALWIERDTQQGGLLLTLRPSSPAGDDTPDETEQQLALLLPTPSNNRDWNC
jgi:hypothetical protein